MQYSDTVRAIFLSRPNRFVAECLVEGETHICHVKNTGRCKELLVPGATVILQKENNPARKTLYDLIAVYKGHRLINMDSQAPNQAAAEFLPSLFPGKPIRREVVCGNSRFDFQVGDGYLEVKGVTLEENGIVRFPDAPTERGVKHVRELTQLARSGVEATVFFVIQMKGVAFWEPNWDTHRAFGEALQEAKAAGVRILAYDCLVTENSMTISEPVPVKLSQLSQL